MARTLTLGQLAALPDRLERAARASFIAQVRAAKDIARVEAARTVGADLRMSGMGRSGVRLGVRDNTVLRAGRWTATIWGRPAGAWSIITDGAGEHSIDRRRRRRRADRRGPAPLATRYGPRVGPVDHPGMTGTGTWRRVKTRVGVELPTRWAADIVTAVRAVG